jgi:hypothetical protein
MQVTTAIFRLVLKFGSIITPRQTPIYENANWMPMNRVGPNPLIMQGKRENGAVP